MARQLGIQRTQWIKYETGASTPGAQILAAICRTHACSADWLLGLKEHSGVSINASDGAAVA
ncbi:MAG: helix-turn-helix transcriptional regulator, partial [Oscillospiraceae bacterium]|nr:helix-turn-helix transcriptional regulator [Oscillospiraceae bacterium]